MAKKKQPAQTEQTALIAPESRDVEIGLEDLQEAMSAPYLAIDIETETRWQGVGPNTKDFGLSYAAPVTVVALTWPKGNGEYGVIVVARESGTGYRAEFEDALKARFKQAAPIIAHNAVFDMRGLSTVLGGATPEYVWDTMVMERLLNPASGKAYGLLQVADAHRVTYPAFMQDMKTQRADLHSLPIADVLKYAAADTQVALKIYEAQQALITDEKIFGLVEWEVKAMREYCRMAACGVAINREYAQKRIMELTTIRDQALEALQTDGLSNPGSPKERVNYLYNVKGIPQPPKNLTEFYTAGGGLSTGAEVIETLSEKYPVLKNLKAWLESDRMAATLVSLLEQAEVDERVHSLIAPQTETGRRASSHPNIQNLRMSANPDDIVGDMAGILVGGEGCTLVEIDYSNAENWIAAMLSGDNALAKACSAEDFHSAMAESYFGDEWRNADKAHRKHLRFQGKRITFGTAYGMGAAKLAYVLGISTDDAKRLLANKDQTFFGVAEAKRRAQEKVQSHGFINLWTGRRIPCDPDKAYTSWNYCCQGAVGEMIKRSIVLIGESFEEKGLKSRVAIDMHDALILEVRHDEWDAAISIASQIMREIIPAKLNARTTPPITWKADADPDDNKKKWGKGQHHPEPSGLPSEIYTAESETEALSILVDHEEKPAVEILRTVQITLPNLNLTAEVVEGETVNEIRGIRTRVKPLSMIPYYEAVISAIQTAVGRARQITLVSGQTVSVDLINYAKACQQWVEKVTSDDPEEDQFWWPARLESAIDMLNRLQAQYQRATNWLQALYAYRDSQQQVKAVQGV